MIAGPWTTACSSSDSGGVGEPNGAGGRGSTLTTGGATAAGQSAFGGAPATGGSGVGAAGSTGVEDHSGGAGGHFAGGASSGGSSNGAGGAGAGGETSGSGGVGHSGGARSTGGAGNTGGAKNSGGTAATASGGGDLSDILEPASGALLGQYYGDGSIAATTTKLGRTLKVDLVYWAWDDDWMSGATKSDFAAGRIPLVNWEPDGIDFNDIVSGALDDTINARAAGAKAVAPKKFFLDFAAEMNGDEAWSGNDAPLYVQAYRHIHDLFEAAGAKNVVWVWCPNVTDTDGSNRHTLDYYPGDDYVDWTGVDGYNWGHDDWQSFQSVFENIYPILAGKKKPIFIGEMASAAVGGDKAAWISAIIPTLKNDYPLIKAVTWFDVNKEEDWRISSTPQSEAAFKAMAADPYFNP